MNIGSGNLVLSIADQDSLFGIVDSITWKGVQLLSKATRAHRMREGLFFNGVEISQTGKKLYNALPVETNDPTLLDLTTSADSSSVTVALGDGLPTMRQNIEQVRDNIYQVDTKLTLSQPSSGADTAVSGAEGLAQVGGAVTALPHFGFLGPLVHMKSTYSVMAYVLDMYAEVSAGRPVGEQNTDNSRSGGSVQTSGDGTIGLGVYAMNNVEGEALTESQQIRWRYEGEMSRYEKMLDGYRVPAGDHHRTVYLVAGSADEIFEGFRDMHNRELIAKSNADRKARRLVSAITN